MKWIILSSILFGLVHPGSKLILDLGIGLTDFCLLYIGIRLALQIPFFIKNTYTKEKKQYPWFLLIFFGLVGAGLQVSEFFGLSKGLPVATVTFLVYSHPIWSLLLSFFVNKEPIGKNEIIRATIGLFGVYLISSIAMGQEFNLELKILAPIFAGFMIALWSSLANKLRKTGLESIEVSFFYDLFAFLSLIIFAHYDNGIGMHITNIIAFVQTPLNLTYMVFYSVIIGLLPNFLFYLGSGTVSNINASLVLLIEPVVATITAYLFMDETISGKFLIGAIFILISGLSFIDITFLISKYFYKITRLGVLIVAFYPGHTWTKTIHLIEVSPRDEMNYIIDEELKLIEMSAKMAFELSKTIFPQCNIQVKKHLEFGSEESLYHYVSKIKSPKNLNEVAVVGFSRSTFARIGAKAVQNKNIFGLSVGASAAGLDKINPNFFSIVAPLTGQVDVIIHEITKLKCQSVAAVFDNKDPLSFEFKKRFQNTFKNKSKILNIDETLTSLEKEQPNCFFIGLNFAKAGPILNQIKNHKKTQHIFGTGDWAIHATEFKKNMQEHKIRAKHQIIHIPTGWTETLNYNSSKYGHNIKKHYKLPPNPIGAYSYDSILITAEKLCTQNEIKNIIEEGKVKTKLLRNYLTIAPTQNIISKMNMLHFGEKYDK